LGWEKIRDGEVSGVHGFISFYVILEDYIQLFISQMFPVIVAAMFDW